jgi:hypothetical protein
VSEDEMKVPESMAPRFITDAELMRRAVKSVSGKPEKVDPPETTIAYLLNDTNYDVTPDDLVAFANALCSQDFDAPDTVVMPTRLLHQMYHQAHELGYIAGAARAIEVTRGGKVEIVIMP